MRPSSNPFLSALDRRSGGATPDFEWEELPSLIHRVVVPMNAAERQFPVVWPATVPMEMSMLPPVQPDAEIVPGIMARELTEPEIHHLFFGRDLLVNPHGQRNAGRQKLGLPPLGQARDPDVVL